MKGSWSVKIEAVVRRVKWILSQQHSGSSSCIGIVENDENKEIKNKDKVIIFTEWNEGMTVIQSCLYENNIDALLYRGNI